jgi:septal ring factor EnvC (AmiA/AmiB activator)
MEWPTITSIVVAAIAVLGVVRQAVKSAEERGRMAQRQDEAEQDIDGLGSKVNKLETRIQGTEKQVAKLEEKIDGVDKKVDSANMKLDKIIGWHVQGHA